MSQMRKKFTFKNKQQINLVNVAKLEAICMRSLSNPVNLKPFVSTYEAASAHLTITRQNLANNVFIYKPE